MIDLATETTFPLAALTKLVRPGRNGKRTYFSTLLRWILRGVKSPTGEIVHLEAIRLGGRWLSSPEALQRFADRLTPTLDTAPAVQPRTASARRRAADRAGKALDRVGI